jgi:hypothetical protein
MLDHILANHLTVKTVKHSIIMNISKDFNLTPLLAEVYFNQIKEYFLRHSQVDLSLGQ